MRKLGPIVPGRKPAVPRTGMSMGSNSVGISGISPASKPPVLPKQLQETLKSGTPLGSALKNPTGRR